MHVQSYARVHRPNIHTYNLQVNARVRSYGEPLMASHMHDDLTRDHSSPLSTFLFYRDLQAGQAAGA